MRLIDADELLNQYPEDEQGEFSFIPLYEVRNSIKRAPTIDTVKHGHWTEEYNGYMFLYECSICNSHTLLKSNYCLDCGAKMDENERTLEYADEDTLMPAT